MTNPANDRKTVGQKIDEVLEPFVNDRNRLRGELKEQTAQRAKIDDQIKQIQHDLTVVERSMLEALREAAANDPLMSAAFRMKPDDGRTVVGIPLATTEASPTSDVPAKTGAGTSARVRRSDSNPLLNPAAAESA